MQNRDKLICVGFISSCFGIKGEVIVKSFTDPITNICNLPLLDSKSNFLELKLVRQKSNQLICSITDINDRSSAESLIKTKLFCKRTSLPELKSEEFYIEDLRGLAVINENEEHIGKIVNIFNFGAGDIIEIKFSNQEVRMLPFEKKYFPKISSSWILLIN